MSGAIWSTHALNEFDPIAYLVGLEQFPDENKPRDDLADTALSLMTVGDTAMLNTLSAERHVITVMGEQHAAVCMGMQ
jgi:hypothetical protein